MSSLAGAVGLRAVASSKASLLIGKNLISLIVIRYEDRSPAARYQITALTIGKFNSGNLCGFPGEGGPVGAITREHSHAVFEIRSNPACR